MRLKDVPFFPAYLVFHDSFDNGAMDVYPTESLKLAQQIASTKQSLLDQSGEEECGIWKAYEKLPRVKIWKFHTSVITEVRA